MRRISIVAAALFLALWLLPEPAAAQGAIDPTVPCQLTLQYRDQEGDTPISGARFDIYRVADVDFAGRYTLTEAFASFPIAFDPNAGGISANAADTMKSYVYAGQLAADGTGHTDGEGRLGFSELRQGIYLVIGCRVTMPDNYTYSAKPFLVQLPGMDEDGGWEYDRTVCPKWEKDFNPPDDRRDRVLTRKAEKQWDDVGYETVRPDSVEVTLFCDREAYDVVELSAKNNWACVWDNLPADHEWELAETGIGGKAIDRATCDYTVTKILNGITWLIVNRFDPVIPAPAGSLIFTKKITGDQLPKKVRPEFAFRLTAKDPGNPMPEGSKDGSLTVTMNGAGKGRFGEITISEPGVYEYTIRELDTGAENFRYDKTVYTLTITAVRNHDRLELDAGLVNSLDQEVSRIEFNNVYKAPKKKLVQTGQLWWPVPLMAFAGLVLIAAGTARGRKNRS